MNKYIYRSLALAGCALLLAGCDENSWNDKLDGFEVPDKNAETQTINYTMTAMDYVQLSKLATAKEFAGDLYGDDLAAVGSLGYFTEEISAEEYIPFFLNQPTFQYFALNNGSAVKVTYLSMGELSDVVKGATNAEKYTVSADDYVEVWGSDENYTEAFAPSKPASRSIPNILKSAYPDAESGDYVIVSYNESATDPVFGGTATETPSFELTNLLGTAASGQTLDVNGYVTAFDTQGFILTDLGGSIYCYRGSNYNDGSIEIGTQIAISGTIAPRNKSIQFGNAATIEVKGKQAVTYPTPKTYTGAELDALVAETEIPAATYVSMTGTVKLNNNNINIIIDGAEKAQGSPSYCTTEQKALLTDGAKVTVEGYWYAVAGNRYCSTCVTKITVNSAATASVPRSRAGVQVASTQENAIYVFDGTTWSVAPDMTVLNHSDYQAMGQTRDNLSGSTPQTVLPTYLKNQYPYAAADDIKYVVYNYYNGSATVVRCAECRFDGTEWTGGFIGAQEVTAQFVKKNGTWQYSPDVTITLPAGRNQPLSTLYYQTCVDWVKNNVPDGDKYVTSFGNNEYYCGTSAYQGNVDLRPNKAVEQYPEGYKDMTDDKIIALEKERFEKEVMPAALSILNGDAAPTASGVEPLYIINFYYYTGSATLPAQVTYKVTAPGTFTYVSSEWKTE